MSVPGGIGGVPRWLDVLRSDANPAGEIVSVAALLVLWALAVLLMRRGYRRRRAADEAALGDLPAVPAPAREPDGRALYTGTTHGGTRADRIAAGGLFGRGPCEWWLDGDTVVFRRVRGPVVRCTGLRDVGLVGAHAGRVLAPGRIAVISWTLGETLVDSGFAFDDAQSAAAFRDSVLSTIRPIPEEVA